MIYQWWNNTDLFHLDAASFLLKERNEKLKNRDYFPENGIICFKDDYEYSDDNGVYLPLIPIAMGFLREVEPQYGLLDSYITNPSIDADLRHESLNKISEKLIKRAKDLEMMSLLTFSRDPSMIERIKGLGFLETDYTFFELTFKKDK